MTKSSRDKPKAGSSSLFAAYLANMNMPLSSHSKGMGRERSLKVNFDNGLPIFGKDIPFQDNMKSELLIRYIAAEHEWFEDQTKSDISILIRNRLYTIKDLRTLSKESWKQIELLPIVKDLLRDMINHGRLSAEEEYLKKKERLEKKKERRLSKDVIINALPITINNNDNTNTSTNNINNNSNNNNEKKIMDFPLPPSSTPKKNEISNKLEVTKHPIRSSSLPKSEPQVQQSPIVPSKDLHNIKRNNAIVSSRVVNKNDDLSVDKVTITKSTTKSTTTVLSPASNLDNVKRFMPKPNKILAGENRLKVKTDSGKIYEIDRYCPHAGSDLFSRGAVVGSKVICSKHYWAFSLENGGECVSGGKGSINACEVNDW